jgi:hypothetical protein
MPLTKLLRRLAFHAAVVISGTCAIVLLILRLVARGDVTVTQAMELGFVLAMALGLVLGLLNVFLERKGVI